MDPSLPSASPQLNIPLLLRLRREGGGFVGFQELRTASNDLEADLRALERFGFQIETHGSMKAAYRGPSPRLCPDQIEHDLGVRWIGRRIAVWNRVSSTNDLAARAAASLSNDGLVILAEEQTAGRGRQGRSWTAPPRSCLLMSVLVFPPAPLLTPVTRGGLAAGAWLTALAAVATAEVVTEWSGSQARIKWPNDIRVDGRKIAGILVECPCDAGVSHPAAGPSIRRSRASGFVIGVGLNANLELESLPPELRCRATSLRTLAQGRLVDRSELARALIRRFDTWYGTCLSSGPEAITAPWSERSEHLGRNVRVLLPAEEVVGRLVNLDLLRGLTLELHSPAADPRIAEPTNPARFRQIASERVLALQSEG